MTLTLRPWSAPLCQTRKRAYRRRRDAVRALRTIQSLGPGCTARRVYICPDCGAYHLTSERAA